MAELMAEPSSSSASFRAVASAAAAAMRASAVACSEDEGAGTPIVCHWLDLALRNSALVLLTRRELASVLKECDVRLLLRREVGRVGGKETGNFTGQRGVFVGVDVAVGVPAEGIVVCDNETCFFSFSLLGLFLRF